MLTSFRRFVYFILVIKSSATVRLHVAYVGSGYYPLSWTPLLDSELELLLEDSKDPPKTASAADMPIGGPPLEAYLTLQSASRRL